MTEETAEVESEEIAAEVELGDADHEGTWLAEGELYLFPDATEIGTHMVFAAAMVGGDVYLGLTADMKMHKLEVVKGMPTKGVVRDIRSKRVET